MNDPILTEQWIEGEKRRHNAQLTKTRAGYEQDGHKWLVPAVVIALTAVTIFAIPYLRPVVNWLNK